MPLPRGGTSPHYSSARPVIGQFKVEVDGSTCVPGSSQVYMAHKRTDSTGGASATPGSCGSVHLAAACSNFAPSSIPTVFACRIDDVVVSAM